MDGNKRNFSLSIWDHKDNFLCNLKSANSDFKGQSYNEDLIENINGEKTLSFSIPMYIFSYDENNIPSSNFIQNEAWNYIKNEEKIRYIEYHPITNVPIKIQEFVLKEFTENRDGEQKIINCICESLAVYELGKIGWGITFDTNYITKYELESKEENGEKISNCPDLLTLDYWMKKLLYKESNIGRVSTTTECTYLLQGIQLRDNEGYPINEEIISSSTGERSYNRIEEPICSSEESEEFKKYYNPTGWTWEVQAKFENDPEKQSISTLYEAPVINQFIETFPNYFVGQSYQKRIGSDDSTKQLRRHPIEENELNEWTYVTDIKKRLVSAERSNIFSIIQDLCETFEIWAYFQYTYSDEGKITERKILFKTESVDENIKFDFSYGKNLKSCSRSSNSNDLITKLHVTNVDSGMIDGNILSIQQSTANPTGENYIYNFDYFYKIGMLTKESEKGIDSDEYKINFHCGNLRNINNKIINIQKFLAPLYDRRDVLQGDLTIEEGSKIGYIDNIQSIQNKIDAIPPNDRLINSWSADNNQYNHVGELKTYSATTRPGSPTESDWLYINFGREDVLVKNLEYCNCYLNNDNILQKDTISTTTINGYIPRVFSYGDWHSGGISLSEDNNTYFINFIEDGYNCIYDYSSIGDGNFIKGIYINKSIVGSNTYGRIRYKYAPLAYYFLLIEDYWNRIGEEEIRINNTQEDLLNIKNRILLYELQLKKLLKEKNESILQFENDYRPFIREGYWEPSDYQSQLSEEIFNTDFSDNFNWLDKGLTQLKDLKLNDSLSTYSYYFNLGLAKDIDIDSIKMRVKSKLDPGTDVYIPHYQGNNYELYLSGENLICAIDPALIAQYEIKGYEQEYYQTEVTYLPIIDGNTQTSTTTKIFDWINEPINVNDYKIYLNEENLITDRLKVYGNSINESNLLIPYEDYSYNYKSVGYDSKGEWVDLSEQESYSTDIQYKYSFLINFKLTNNTIRFLAEDDPKFILDYAKETTLQYIYNDSVATSKKYSTPQVEYNISVVDLSSLNGYEDYKPKIGQKVPIFDEEMHFHNFEGFITSINYPLEEKYNTELTIATYGTKFEEVFQKLTATMSDISYNSNDIYKAVNSFEANGAIRTDVFKKSLQDNFEAVNLGVNNEITIDETEGITLKDSDNNYGVKLIGRGIFLTKDITQGASTDWRTGITGEGINTNVLTAGSIDTKQITIWNSSEKQARFVWNEQGLFAYADKFGTSTTTETPYQELIDYSKYVKYNQEGLEFSDNGNSALSLGWQGLKIQAQNKALQLDADNGLVLKDSTTTTRLELGVLDHGILYGLRLSSTSGVPTFQSDSDGNLWLHQHIRLGGEMVDGKVQNPTAGIYGLSTNVPREMQMGVRRNNEGEVIWDETPIRFWAGPQTQEDYKNNIHIDDNDIDNLKIPGQDGQFPNIFKSLKDKESPSLAKFKVSANGDIIASGIDVGGWIGEGDKLRSFDNEAILRSNGYDSSNNNYPLIAIGKNGETTYGSNYNFKVYQDGSINIGNGRFIATSTGAVTAKNIIIEGGTTNIDQGRVASLSITNGGLESTTTIRNIVYLTGLYGVSGTTAYAFRSGPSYNNKNKKSLDPNFSVDGFGNLTAKSAVISGTVTASAGSIGGWSIGTANNQNGIQSISTNGSIFINPNSNSNSPVISIASTTTMPAANNTNTMFAVTGKGDVYFKHGIYGWSSEGFKKGLTSAEVKEIYTAEGRTKTIEICQGLIVDMT